MHTSVDREAEFAYEFTDQAISPPSVVFQVGKLPPSHIRDPSFAYGDQSVFEVQPMRQASPCAAVSFFSGASLNNSQMLEGFPLPTKEERRSSEFGHPEVMKKAAPQEVKKARTSTVQRPTRLKKDDDGRRGISIPTFDRIQSGLRRAQTPQNRSLFRTTVKKTRGKLNISPLEVALNTAYLPCIRTPEPKRITLKKPIRTGKRPRVLTPDSLLPGYPL